MLDKNLIKTRLIRFQFYICKRLKIIYSPIMKQTYSLIKFFLIICFFNTIPFFAQVGIGTVDPDSNAALDIFSENSGILIPRVALTATDMATPLTGPVTQGLLVYNTATTSEPYAVSPGFYYHNGARRGVQWHRIAVDTGPSTEAWYLTGNENTTDAHFLGTNDDRPLLIATNGTPRFIFSTEGRLQAFDPGTAMSPSYSWKGRGMNGMFSAGENQIGFSTRGRERIRINGEGHIGLGADLPSEVLHVEGNFRLEGAFKPGNHHGEVGNMLMSMGPDHPPVWGPGFLNRQQIKNIGKFYVPPFVSNAQSILTISVTDPHMTEGTTVVCNFIPHRGLAEAVPGHELYLEAVPGDGEVVFYVTNLSEYQISNLQIVYTATYL